MSDIIDSFQKRLEAKEKELSVLKRQLSLFEQDQIFYAHRLEELMLVNADLKRSLAETKNLLATLTELRKSKRISFSKVSKLFSCKKKEGSIDTGKIELLLGSPLFDPLWYSREYIEPAKYKGTLEEHFLYIGWKKGYNPSLDFDTVFYLESNSDVKASGENPLVHYLTFGAYEGRLPLKD